MRGCHGGNRDRRTRIPNHFLLSARRISCVVNDPLGVGSAVFAAAEVADHVLLMGMLGRNVCGWTDGGVRGA